MLSIFNKNSKRYIRSYLKISVFFLSILVLQSVSTCKAPIKEYSPMLTAKTEKKILAGSLIIANELREKFTDIDREFYTHAEAEHLFHEFQKKSDRVCPMVYNYMQYDQKKVNDFLKGLSLKKDPEELWYNKTMPQLIAGCWNFYRMNDIDVGKDFETVAKYYPYETKECYSVALIQPYMMQSILRCNKITMLDVDWRILHTHHAFIYKYDNGDFYEEYMMNEKMKDLPVHWLARFDRKPVLKEDQQVGLNTFCDQNSFESCKDSILQFQRNFQSIKEINLNLSYLHTGRYEADEGAIVVIYLSNALDREYMSKDNFDTFLNSVYIGLKPGQKAVFVYHVGGSSKFGIYEMEKGFAFEKKIRTVCKDVYRLSAVYKNRRKFNTYFERVSESKAPYERCSEEETKTAKE
ncbi:MAG: hypothetical protein H7A24_04175 [Leptospiraceae bacterium]|nr:hypothetical protein [Leptospiraceae bacterium]MCP5511051.1 hypothetical protein [Leptospiraceae bacterium]